MKTIICSHGFAVRADSMGMFTDIAAKFSSYDFRMFDYYEIKANGDQFVRPLEEQAKILQQEIDAAEGEVILLCHSQGSTVAGMVDLTRVSKVVLLAPPVDVNRQRLMERLSRRQGSELDPKGMSIIPRSNGTNMYIPVEYLDSIERTDRMELYQKIANAVPAVIIRATRDEIIGLTRVNEIKNAQHIDINADHNFTGENRQKLIDTLTMIF